MRADTTDEMKTNATCAEAELQKNAMLKAVRPGGILHDYPEKGPVEVLFCPQQSFLEESGLAPFLLLPPPPSNGKIPSAVLTFAGRSITLTLEQQQQVARVLREQLLDYHLVHFDNVASPAFVTVRGQRGEFAGNLERVARYGRIGTAAVLCDTSPLLPRDDSDVGEFHPCKLHIFFIADALMDEQELHNTLAVLKRVVLPQHQQEEIDASGGRFSRESISNYHRLVADDNDVHFTEFKRYMALPVCAPLAKTLSNFVETVQQREMPMFDNTDVRRATAFCLDQCRRIPLFASDAEKFHMASEGFEKYIMTKLYSRAFGVVPEEPQRNKELTEKLRQLSPLVTAEQLDALKGVENHHMWGQAMLELEAMNFFKTPREKLRCVVRACRHLAKAIGATLNDKVRNGDNSSSSRSSTVSSVSKCNKVKKDVTFGADEMLPCFMLLVLRACPENFYLNMQYIKRFRESTLMDPEEAYCLANLESAVEFWISYVPSHQQRREQQKQLPTQEKAVVYPPPLVEDLFAISTGTPPVAGGSHSPEQEISPARSRSSCLSPLGAKQERINVAKLLLEEKKAFDDLTVAELRAVVEEARRLVAETTSGNAAVGDGGGGGGM